MTLYIIDAVLSQYRSVRVIVASNQTMTLHYAYRLLYTTIGYVRPLTASALKLGLCATV
jgi:hypothetical protein